MLRCWQRAGGNCFTFPRCGDTSSRRLIIIDVTDAINLNLAESSYEKFVYEHQFDKREMTDSDFDFYPWNWKNPLGYTHFCFWNHQNPLFRPQNSPLKFYQKIEKILLLMYLLIGPSISSDCQVSYHFGKLKGWLFWWFE